MGRVDVSMKVLVALSLIVLAAAKPQILQQPSWVIPTIKSAETAEDTPIISTTPPLIHMLDSLGFRQPFLLPTDSLTLLLTLTLPSSPPSSSLLSPLPRRLPAKSALLSLRQNQRPIQLWFTLLESTPPALLSGTLGFLLLSALTPCHKIFVTLRSHTLDSLLSLERLLTLPLALTLLSPGSTLLLPQPRKPRPRKVLVLPVPSALLNQRPILKC